MSDRPLDKMRSRFMARTVEIQTYVGCRDRYLVRADLDIAGPIRVFPFAIYRISGPRLWTAPFQERMIRTERPPLDFEEARLVLQGWAVRTIAVEILRSDVSATAFRGIAI